MYKGPKGALHERPGGRLASHGLVTNVLPYPREGVTQVDWA